MDALPEAEDKEKNGEKEGGKMKHVLAMLVCFGLGAGSWAALTAYRNRQPNDWQTIHGPWEDYQKQQAELAKYGTVSPIPTYEEFLKTYKPPLTVVSSEPLPAPINYGAHTAFVPPPLSSREPDIFDQVHLEAQIGALRARVDALEKAAKEK